MGLKKKTKIMGLIAEENISGVIQISTIKTQRWPLIDRARTQALKELKRDSDLQEYAEIFGWDE
jgi:hypothetical protein